MAEPRIIRPTLHPTFPRPWAGAVELQTFDSQCLVGNALGDPPRRSVGIYRPPDGRTEGRPLIVFLAGFSGASTSEAHAPGFLRESLLGILDPMILRGEVPPMSVLLVDCLTSLGGSQYVNSAATGPYADYLLDELLPWATQTVRPSSVAVMGQSSG